MEEAPTPPGGGGAPTYDFAKISPKLHEIERIWAPAGWGVPHPLDPPLQIALQWHSLHNKKFLWKIILFRSTVFMNIKKPLYILKIVLVAE